MRTIKAGDRSNPVTSESNSSSRANLKRRRFLFTLGAAGAGATAVVARSISQGNIVAPAAEAVSADGGYAATEHVKTYYKTAKL
jgi:hypothetical protein